METAKHILFYGHTPNHLNLHFFSQWYKCQFVETINSQQITYTSAEQYMMAHKALLFKDDNTFGKILKNTNQAVVKNLGREVKGYTDAIWNKHKFDIVVNGNRLKFGQNKLLMDRLLGTGDKILVEASPYDKIWGIGLSVVDAVKVPEDLWPGENLLGKALMVVRDENK